jgi:hypothetical protein
MSDATAEIALQKEALTPNGLSILETASARRGSTLLKVSNQKGDLFSLKFAVKGGQAGPYNYVDASFVT